MTYGEAMTRLCQLRDELKKTPEGRAALAKVIETLQRKEDAEHDQVQNR